MELTESSRLFKEPDEPRQVLHVQKDEQETRWYIMCTGTCEGEISKKTNFWGEGEHQKLSENA